MDRKQRAKKRVSSESTPATPTTSGKKSRKRAAAQRKASAEAQRGDDEKRDNKHRRIEEKCSEQKGREMAASRQKDSPSLSKSIDKAELVRRAVAHAAAAAEYFPADQDDDEESDGADKPGEPAIARNLKVELGQASEHTTVNLEEAPDAKDKGVREALERRPIPVVEASALPPLQVFGANTAAQLQSNAKARASAVDRATTKLPSGTVPPVEAAPMYRPSHADGLTEWTRTPSFEFAAKLSNTKEQAAFSTWAITGTCDPNFEHLIPRTLEADANTAPIIEPIETVAPVTQPQARRSY